MTIDDLQPGDNLTHGLLVSIFKCGNMGGMRKSHQTQSLVLISDPTKGVYEDRWENDVLHYTGMGKTGDQVLVGNQNKTLYESEMSAFAVHLFEVLEKGHYTYRGRVKLLTEPYQEQQLDGKGMPRKVWMFPLKLLDANPMRAVSTEDLEKKFEARARVAKKRSLEELKRRAQVAGRKASRRIVHTTYYERNADISEYINEKPGVSVHFATFLLRSPICGASPIWSRTIFIGSLGGVQTR